jgi:prophage DNA circulation protein
MAWRDQLQQASFRGVPFGVLTIDNHDGREVAVHTYFGRDDVWPEDVGGAPSRHGILGFLVTDSKVYGGGDVLQQRTQMVAACKTKGSGTLVHPTLGALTVTLVTPLITRERWDSGRYFEIQFDFVEAGKQLFPSSNANTGQGVQTAATNANGAASNAFSQTLLTV